MRIVKLNADEWATYRELRLESLRVEPDAFAASYERSAARPEEWWRGRLEAASHDPRQNLLFAEAEEGGLVGMIGAYPDEQGVQLISMYVRPSSRRQGIGAALVEALLSELASLDPQPAVWLTVHEDQPAAVALYQKCGFCIVEIIDRPPGRSCERELVMRHERLV